MFLSINQQLNHRTVQKKGPRDETMCVQKTNPKLKLLPQSED